MDKNNRKKANTSAIWQEMLHIYHQVKYSCPSRSNKKQQEPHKRAQLSENGGLGEKRSGVWAKSRKV